MKICQRALVTLLILFSLAPIASHAGPWLTSGEPYQSSANFATKSDIDFLASYGFIDTPVLTWPIAWVNIGPSLESDEAKKKYAAAPPFARAIFDRVLAQYKRETTKAWKASVFVSGGHKINPFRTFEFQPRNDIEAGGAIEKQNDHFAGNLALAYGQYDDVTDNVHLDYSYLYAFLGNWGLGVDKMPRWWSPAYTDSMILSNNAPPLPTLTLQRMHAEAFDTKWLHWLGPWSLTTSLSVGSPDVPVSHPLIWLTNIDLRPLDSLQLSVSRVAFFAGDSRPLNWRMFGNLLIVNDNCAPEREGSYYCDNYSPGTEHWEATIDWNWQQLWQIPADFYLQTIFNDRVPHSSAPWLYQGFRPPVPGRTAFLAGTNTWFPVKDYGYLRLYLEFEYTYQYVYYFWGQLATNIYGYSAYPYTYYGKIIGSALGNEAKGYSLGGVFNETNGNTDNVMIRYLQLNGLSMTGSGYPYSHQDVLWLSFERTMTLPQKLGRLTGQLGYLKSINGAGFSSTPSFFLTWTHDFT